MDGSFSESAWRRGWRDTKTAWTSWQFVIFDVLGGAAVTALAQLCFGQWFWGILVAVFGLVCVWFGATVSAPVRQRDEARKYIVEHDHPAPVDKPPLPLHKSPFRLIPKHKVKRVVHRTETVDGKTKYIDEIETDP